MKRIQQAGLIALMLLLNACVTTSEIEPGTNTLNGLSFETGMSWAKLNDHFTIDGIALNRISVNQTTKGAHILGAKINDQTKPFIYQTDRAIEETVELFIDALSAAGSVANVALDFSESTTINGNEAAKFDYLFDNEMGLTYRSTALFIQKDNTLYMLTCSAPLEHYFAVYEREFKNIIASAKIANN